ncbi:hypothetical protein [Methylobacterium sp. Leaf85]|uniref:hypothetical protein n=1 Tax=Methylobacterium sp. Leaf85 TaxID=1736241 RepID=UPI0006F717AA|nr:hypothetical protein [Methylobacterium sp. Leaf85]KQO49955.1 hypothetical protein ASF08_22730 [Methylobacterium sp. Leaf85]
MSTERAEGYVEALADVRDAVRRRVNEPDVSNDGKLELLDLLSRLDDMLKGGEHPEEPDNAAPEPLSGSF